ncbi:MAG: hypothetical protein AUI47_04625 [Acidobacteria bacterium 13_1_40CM_2_68_5]|nr:MAG: hypothetical protein AUI47_04625 [Acidobacteria bacterium 13_1_40CM_2_68_5]
MEFPLLVWHEKVTDHIYGATQLWITIFSETKPPELTGRLTTLVTKSTNPFAGLLGLLSKSAPGDEESDSKKESAPPAPQINWYHLNSETPPNRPTESGGPIAYLDYGIARVDVPQDTVDRFSLYTKAYCSMPPSEEATKEGEEKKPEAKRDKAHSTGREESKKVCDEEGDRSLKPAFISAHATFSNSRASYAGISFSAGVTTRVRDTSVGGGVKDMQINGYVVGKVYLARVLRPTLRPGAGSQAWLYRPSLGVALGTNVTGNLFDEVLVGLAFGHLIGKTGVILGINSIAPSKDTPGARRDRPFIGIEYTF